MATNPDDGWLIPANWPVSLTLAKSALDARGSAYTASDPRRVAHYLCRACAAEGLEVTEDDLLAFLSAPSTRSPGPVPVDDR